jgi:hypothetical protein
VKSDSDPLERFRLAAVEWAAGGRGQPLVDAAAEALVDGIDSPSLRVLAGTIRISADLETKELAPTVFAELGLSIDERMTPQAMLTYAKQAAQQFLTFGGQPRVLAEALYRAYIDSGYVAELSDFSGIDDWYDMIDGNVIAGSLDEVDSAVTEAAEALLQGSKFTRSPWRNTEPADVPPSANSKRRRFSRWRKAASGQA